VRVRERERERERVRVRVRRHAVGAPHLSRGDRGARLRSDLGSGDGGARWRRAHAVGHAVQRAVGGVEPAHLECGELRCAAVRMAAREEAVGEPDHSHAQRLGEEIQHHGGWHGRARGGQLVQLAFEI